MSEEQRRLLEQQLWNIANTLRGKMDADEFRDYILGFIFYKYLSEKMNAYADDILDADGITYQSIDENTDEGREYLEAVRHEAVESLGYFLKPSELFSSVARRGNGNGSHGNTFILEDLQRILNNIEQSTMGTDSEEDFDHLFEDLDLRSTKLGRTEAAKNELIAKVLAHLDKIDFRLEDTEADVIGDAYEYLISQFAAGAGKKAGEFYTPQEVSKVLAKIVTVGKERLKTVYDPTCGSGSLLLRVAKEVKDVGKFYGQELNRTTYNLARMNMILHGVNYQKFDIKQEDSLEHPQHPDLRAEALVANPPFSAKWSANPLHLGDDRFSQYGRLAPASKADWAFIQHMIHHLGENGTMAVVAPHGVLFRGAAEGHIRRYLIEDRNYLDAVIGLPANIFYGTSIPTCVLVFKKCKEHPDNVLFIDASQGFERRGNQNYLRAEDIDKIVLTYRERSVQDRFSFVASLDEIKENEYNLNIPRYVDISEEEVSIDLALVSAALRDVDTLSNENDTLIESYCNELELPIPAGRNLVLLQEYKRGLMKLLFEQRVRFKSGLPVEFGGWRELQISDVCRILYGKDQKQVAAEGGKYPILGTGGEIGRTNEFLYDKPSVLIGRKGTIDRPRYMDTPFWTVDTLFYTEVFTDHVPKWLFYQFQMIDWYRFNEASGVPSLSASTISNIKIDVPEKAEQEKIAGFLTAIDRKIELLSEQIDLTFHINDRPRG